MNPGGGEVNGAEMVGPAHSDAAYCRKSEMCTYHRFVYRNPLPGLRARFFDICFLKIRINAMLAIVQGQADIREGRPAKDGTRKVFSVEGVSASG
jgi:hypothetical protein